MENIMKRFILCLLASLIAIPAAAQQQAPMRSIVNVTGQLYRAQNNNHYTVFLVTPDGVIMSDPINRDFARYLKAEIASRFKVPVRYVLYTHSDWDHASGGVVFADTAEFVGHVNMLTRLAPPPGNPPLPADTAKLDANKNSVLDRSEATGNLVNQFTLYDADRNGLVSGAELARGPVSDVYAPTITFTDRHTVTLGGKRVTMTHLGTAHADDSAVLYFSDERAVFSADILQVRRLPGGIDPTVGAYIDALRTINNHDYDHALTGHALAGTKKDALMLQQYLEDLTMGVAAGIAAGRSLQEIQKSLTLEMYKGFERWDTNREAHIAAVYEMFKGARREAPGTR
jgi:glyoxylase-like metal-dependent hydrolase (beta-lactamase superfamily II)